MTTRTDYLMLAASIRCGIFGERNTVKEAMDYVNMLAAASHNPPAVLTAVGVMLNTVSNQLMEMAGPRPTEADQDAYRAAANEMSRSGGGFAGSIADAYLKADSMNGPRLVAAFPELFEKFKPEPRMLAILKDRHGTEVDRITLEDSDPMDCDHFANRFAESLGFELDADGIVPDGTEDYSVTLTDDPTGVRSWKSANYMIAEE